ncbi:uncharacterized protein LOC135837407 [Planococcus citri]|uniref:uncharacterized protein LOC135837407 n=1 Tax=Planococcus citri TaxID=170843 RepID=UPI0031F9B065
MAHDELPQLYPDKIRKNNIRLSIVLGFIIVINILALLHKHEKITEVRPPTSRMWWRYNLMYDFAPKWDVARIAVLNDIYDVDPDYFNYTFAQDQYLDKKVKAHFITEAVDRSLLMLQTALSTYAVIIFIMFNQPSTKKSAILGVLVVSLISDLPLIFYIPFTTTYHFLNDSLSPGLIVRFLVFLFYGALKILGALWTVEGIPEESYKQQMQDVMLLECIECLENKVALAERNVPGEHRELAALAGCDAPREQATLAASA